MSLKIWISSFIPATISGYTLDVPGQAGKSMIPGPTPASDCYHTDQRGFAADPNASARMRSLVELSQQDFALITQNHHCDFTVECDCEDGDEECRRAPATADLVIKNLQTSAALCKFAFEGGAGNPCATGAPQINWSVQVEVKRLAGGKIQVAALSGSKVEPFPAFEMYASLNGAVREVFKVGPQPGTTPWDLVGPPNRPVSGTVAF
ncbi:DUF3238 domain-containing protein [Massilia endophytica]|uniref:DUF3238 domain-containing protein n=1 Tax=Massilia endophytica TaxID=2899220 RepID=UPI001E3D109D|nr:DUF3238 domain-containing protein [Massilia endophytica]UGQ46842.1 DUF3238 domain-containing protein [Massilia endophytica]